MGSEKKNILYIGGFELPDKNAAAHRVIANGKMLAELNYDVFYLGVQDTKDTTLKVEDTKSTFEGFTYWSLKYPRNFIEWYKYIADADQIIDVIENHLPALPYAIIAYDYPAVALAKLLSYCRKKKILLIGDTTDWYKVYRGNLLFRIIKSFDTNYRMRWLHNHLDGMITVSRYLYDYYKKRAANVLFLPPLVDIAEKKWEDAGNNLSEELRLVYAGQPFSKGSGKKDRIDKVLFALSEAIKKRPINFKLLVIGITQDYYLENYGINTIPVNIKDKVIFLGRLSHKEVLKEIQIADYSIFIRDDYRVTRAGFPTKFVESITSGTPVLTNSSSNIDEYLIEGEFGFLLNTSNQQRLTDSLLNAIAQPKKEIIKMKLACKRSQLFDYHQFLNSMDEFLKKVRDSK
jgi:glycosyltransferase involved in cell wall biosynthesis